MTVVSFSGDRLEFVLFAVPGRLAWVPIALLWTGLSYHFLVPTPLEVVLGTAILPTVLVREARVAVPVSVVSGAL